MQNNIIISDNVHSYTHFKSDQAFLSMQFAFIFNGSRFLVQTSNFNFRSLYLLRVIYTYFVPYQLESRPKNVCC